MRERIRELLEQLKSVHSNLYEDDFLLTWGRSEADLRAVLLTTEILEQFYEGSVARI